jgi:hypothetical protein
LAIESLLQQLLDQGVAQHAAQLCIADEMLDLLL